MFFWEVGVLLRAELVICEGLYRGGSVHQYSRVSGCCLSDSGLDVGAPSLLTGSNGRLGKTRSQRELSVQISGIQTLPT
jgi:hypothetical protein